MHAVMLILVGPMQIVWASVGIPGIPEPDMILWGDLCRATINLPSTSGVQIVARTTGPSGTIEVGRYTMGDNPRADDCDETTDCYTLRIRLETVLDGLTPSGNAVLLDPVHFNSVQIFWVEPEPGQSERKVAEVLVKDRGIIQRLDLNTVLPTTDLNLSGATTKADYPRLRQSLVGPAVTPSDPCDQADINRDGRIDVKDFSRLQNAIQGGSVVNFVSALPAASAGGNTIRVMSRTQKNETRIDFGGALPVDPPAGSIRVREMLANGTFGVDIPYTNFNFTRTGSRLVIQDKASNLAHRHWYQVESPTGMWPGVGAFCLQFAVQAGDCDGSGAVNSADLSCVNSQIPKAPAQAATDTLFTKDINAASGINAADLSAVNANVPSAPVAKPSGHTTCP